MSFTEQRALPGFEPGTSAKHFTINKLLSEKALILPQSHVISNACVQQVIRKRPKEKRGVPPAVPHPLTPPQTNRPFKHAIFAKMSCFLP